MKVPEVRWLLVEHLEHLLWTIFHPYYQTIPIEEDLCTCHDRCEVSSRQTRIFGISPRIPNPQSNWFFSNLSISPKLDLVAVVEELLDLVELVVLSMHLLLP